MCVHVCMYESIRNLYWSFHCKCLCRRDEISDSLFCVAITNHLRLINLEQEFIICYFQRLGCLRLWHWYVVRVFLLHLYMVESKRAKCSEYCILTWPQRVGESELTLFSGMNPFRRTQLIWHKQLPKDSTFWHCPVRDYISKEEFRGTLLKEYQG